MKTECRRELLLFPHDLPGNRQEVRLTARKAYYCCKYSSSRLCTLLFVKPAV